VLVVGVDDDSAAVRYYRAGADLALPSESSGLMVAAGLDALARRPAPQETRVLRVGSLTVDRDGRTAQVDSRPVKLVWRRVRIPAPMFSDRFRVAVEHGNLDQAAHLFSEDAVFRSPVLFKPYEGRDQVVKVPRAAERVLGLGGEFRYVHQLEDPDDRIAMLEFATIMEGNQAEGIDKLTFDTGGMITELKVMIRPASALQLVGAKMAEEFPKVGLRLPR
jgi:hypothetical protein